MGKRSSFERVPRDLYKTPWEPVVALSPYITDITAFAETCAGDGTLVRHLERLGHECSYACDSAPEHGLIGERYDAMMLNADDLGDCSHIVTNPPWPGKGRDGQPTMDLIRHLSVLKPTWLLLQADFAHNAYAAEVMAYCGVIVSVGRVKWMPDSEFTGKDNCAWYLFDQITVPQRTVFIAHGTGRPVYVNGIGELVG